MFPVLVASSFYLIVREAIPDAHRILFVNLVELGELIILMHMSISVLYLWTLGRAICSRTGNLLYLSMLFIMAVLGAGVYRQMEVLGYDAAIWGLSWTVQFLAGAFVVFFPLNSVDFFILLPPFRTFTVTGLTSVILWLVTDLLFCLGLGWGAAALLHPVSFLAGIIAASTLLRLHLLPSGVGDRTLWQWIRGEKSGEELAWKQSWSDRRKHSASEENEQEKRNKQMEQKEQAIKTKLSPANETVKILCQCGNVISLGMEDSNAKCGTCGRIIRTVNTTPS